MCKNKALKSFLLFALCMLTSLSAWSVPAYRGWQTKSLSDGSPITVRQLGDEFYHYWETEDGRMVTEQADGTFVLSNEAVPTKAQANAKRAAAYKRSSKPRKAIGERNLAPRGLLVLVQFSDVSFKSANNNAAFNNMLNQAGYDYNGATGSAVDYFKAQSNNAYQPVFDVVGPVTLSHNLKYYGEQGTINGNKENDMYIADFVIDAVTAAEEAGCDFSKYDGDNNGYVDIVYFIYAGKGQANGGSAETIWPHNWELRSALYCGRTHGGSGYYVNVNSQGYVTSENLPTFDGKKINSYACSGELRSDGNRSGIGTFCHEFSHVLGLPDYYDADGDDNGENVQTPQKWSIMDYGSYNNNEMTPPNYSIYDKYFMGWATPKFLAKDEKKNVSMTTGYNDAYQITGGSSRVDYNSTSTVYYIENRQQTGWDAALPGHGMLVWQVKYSSSVWAENAPNNTAGNARYTIIPADGKTSSYGWGSDTYPGTSNVTSYTPKTGCAMTDIAENANVITFKYNGGEAPKTECDYTLYGEHCTYPEDGVIAINSTLSLTITPDAGYSLADASCWDVEMGGVKLTYGTDFTYNESTNEFRIEEVTDDVEILIEGKAAFQITWKANGITFTTTISAGSVVLPENEPEVECNGKVFVGWCADAHYENETTAPTYIQNGNAITSDTTFYAVFAEEHAGSGTPTVQKATSIAIGDEVVLVYESGTMELTSFSTSSTIYGIGSAYTTTPSGSYSFTVVAGNTEGSVAFERDGKYWYWNSGNSLSTSNSVSSGSSWNVSFSSGNAVIANTSATSRKIRWNSSSPRFACYTEGQQAVQLYKVSGGATTYSDYTTSCSLPTEVTVTFDANGGTGEMSAQLIPYNEATALGACTFTRTGYSFAGWATSATGEKVYNNQASVTLIKSTTLYAVWTVNNYNVTFEPSITGATVTINGQSTSPQSVTYGTIVTINTTVDPDYRLISIAAQDANEHAVELTGTGNSHTFTMPASAVAVSVVVELIPTHSVTWSANGDNSNTVTYKEGATIVFPTTATGCDGKVFRGWSATTVAETDQEPTYVEEATMGTNDITYYAVFATQEGESILYKLVETLTNGKEYIFVTRNTAGSGYAFSSAITTGTSVTIVESGSDKIVSGTPANSIIWTVATGYSLTTNDETKTNKKLKINGGTFGLDATGSSDLDWTTNYGLNGNSSSGATQYYLQCSSLGTFSKGSTTGSTTNRVWAYEKTGGVLYTDFTTSCAPCTSAVTITKGMPEHGSFTMDITGEQSTCSGAVVVTISDIEPESNAYRFLRITQTGPTEGVTIDQDAKTVTYAKRSEGASIINVEFEKKPTYTITFYNNGSIIGEAQTVIEGEEPKVPVVSACEGYTFVGWWNEALAADNTTEYTWIEDFTATQDSTYYAIYSKTDESDTGGSVLFDFEEIATANSWGHDTNHPDITIDPISIHVDKGTSGYQGRWWNTDKTWRIYNGNTITITSSVASITNVTSDPSRSFFIDGNKATFSDATNFKSITVEYGNASTTYYTSVEACSSTDIEHVETKEQAAVKELRDGQIVIIRGEAVYSITGERIK